jgi:hypothetical protein
MPPKEKDGSPVIDDMVSHLRIMVIPNTPLASEIVIADDLFEGMISPTRGRNLIVVWKKSKSIEQFSTLLAASINW